MKITFKNSKLINRITNTGIALIAVATLTGCAPAKVNTTEYVVVPVVAIEANKKQDEIIDTTKDAVFVDVTLNPIIESIANQGTTDIKSKLDTLLDKLDDYEAKISDTTLYTVDNIDKLLKVDGTISKEEEYIASYAYQKLLASNINRETFIRELHNMMVEQILPRCATEEEYQLNFGNILTTLGEQESLYDTYYSLAWLTHDADCEDEHYITEYGSLGCKTLIKEFNEKHNQKDS